MNCKELQVQTDELRAGAGRFAEVSKRLTLLYGKSALDYDQTQAMKAIGD
jgi:hypothetical protein